MTPGPIFLTIISVIITSVIVNGKFPTNILSVSICAVGSNNVAFNGATDIVENKLLPCLTLENRDE
jgi:hypothetical protein